MSNRIREALIEALRNLKDATLQELGHAAISGRLDLSQLRVTDLVGGGRGMHVSSKATEFTITQKGIDKIEAHHTSGQILTRTKDQRIAFDRAVLLTFCRDDEAWTSLSSVDITNALVSEGVGEASPDQLRKSLHRSIESGLVKSKGKARGTRYSLTSKGRKRVA